jgi:hypothetical protein
MVICDIDITQTFEVMTSTYLLGTLGSVTSLLAVILYEGYHDSNLKGRYGCGV